MNKTQLKSTPVENPELLATVPSIKELRQKGWRIHTLHQRFYSNVPIPLTRVQAIFLNKNDDYTGKILPYGGLTTVELFDGEMNYVGVSICTLTDNFCKKKGVKIAIFKALCKK